MSRQLWVRLGDAGDYEVVGSPYDAGYQVGAFYEGKSAPKISWRGMGVEVDPIFVGYNYVSLFWGDEDAQPVEDAELTASERAEFKGGLWEGADIKVARKAPAKSAKPKPKRKAGAPSTSLRGVRR